MASSDIARLIEHRLGRRAVLGAIAGAAVAGGARAQAPGFTPLAHALGERLEVASGHRAQVLIGWGDKVLAGAPEFDPSRLTAAAQASQFGYNNDFIAYMPLPAGSRESGHGLLCVNFEFASSDLMWPDAAPRGRTTAAQVDVEMAALGHGVIEIRREAGAWRVVENSRHARRITAHTPMRLSGPASGHARLRTSADPTGTRVAGTIANCAGGVTPWGTVLLAEEGFEDHFTNAAPTEGPEARNHQRYGIRSRPWHAWGRFHDRFDVAKEPREPNRFGWLVELDPYDPVSVPVKRTALGRFKHESASVVVNRDGRVVVYSGDDEREEFLYRFVSQGRFDARNPAAAREILDQGTLSVARFHDDGRLTWHPLVVGEGPLTAANGFTDQGALLIETRFAADAWKATTLDRPEDIEVDPRTGRVYVALTGDASRRPERLDAAGLRAPNPYGHVLELIAPGAAGAVDHAAPEFRWDVLFLGGDPRQAAHGARYGAGASGFLANPDNLAFDPRGRLWIATDGQQGSLRVGEGLYAMEVSGPRRAEPRLFLNAPRGAELCGPCFTPDGTTLFLAIQHPGEGSSFASPSTRWPDFRPDRPPRPAVVAITREGGGEIGG